jgi:4-amino-4-deoxychorismate lyase
MLDDRGLVISGTQTNLFAVIAGRIVTPALDQCGVAGVMRGAFRRWAAEHETATVERGIRAAELETATEMFVTNALIGAWPVRELAGSRMPRGSLAARFNDWLAGQG